MKNLIPLLIVASLTACPKRMPEEVHPTQPSSSADIFSTVDAWQQTDAGKPHLAWSVERVIYVGDAYEVVLADASVDSGGEAVILRVVRDSGAWRVDTINRGPADYLWPSN